MKKLSLLAIAATLMLSAPRADACVSGCFVFSLAFPALNCVGDFFTRTGSSIVNNTIAVRLLTCMVPANSRAGVFADFLSINVTPGTSCFVLAGDALGNFWTVPPTITKTFSGFLEHDWTFNSLAGAGGRNASIQCNVIPGGKAFQYFEQTSWEGIQ
jgi:hypothetical protein